MAAMIPSQFNAPHGLFRIQCVAIAVDGVVGNDKRVIAIRFEQNEGCIPIFALGAAKDFQFRRVGAGQRERLSRLKLPVGFKYILRDRLAQLAEKSCRCAFRPIADPMLGISHCAALHSAIVRPPLLRLQPEQSS